MEIQHIEEKNKLLEKSLDEIQKRICEGKDKGNEECDDLKIKFSDSEAENKKMADKIQAITNENKIL